MSRRMQCLITAMASLALAMLTAYPAAAQRGGPASRPPATRRPTPAAARSQAVSPQSRLTIGAYGLAAPGVTITSGDFDGDTFNTSFGPGAGLMVGYDFNRTLTSYVTLDLARQSSAMSGISATFGLAHFEVGVRAKLPLSMPPGTTAYVNGGIGRRAIGGQAFDDEDEEAFHITFSGLMLGFGGGVIHTISPHLALDAGLELGYGHFGNVEDDGDKYGIQTSGSLTTRLRVGFDWRP